GISNWIGAAKPETRFEEDVPKIFFALRGGFQTRSEAALGAVSNHHFRACYRLGRCGFGCVENRESRFGRDRNKNIRAYRTANDQLRKSIGTLGASSEIQL